MARTCVPPRDQRSMYTGVRRRPEAGYTSEAAEQIDRLLQPVGVVAEGLVGLLTRDEIAAAAVEAKLKPMVNGNEVFFGGTVACRPTSTMCARGCMRRTSSAMECRPAPRRPSPSWICHLMAESHQAGLTPNNDGQAAQQVPQSSAPQE